MLITAGVPVVWAVSVIAQEPRTLVAAAWDERMMGLFVRTIITASLASIGAVLIAMPVAYAMGRSTNWPARALWIVVPLPLLLPTMVTGYGWQQLLAIFDIHPMPQSTVDVARCVGILATWLFPVPAVAIAMVIRRLDESLLEQAAIDGVLGRFVLRRMIAPATLSFLVCVVLAMQEFSIFEPTGISVMATEIRMIFETGMLSSSSNPIAGLVGGVGIATASDLPGRAALALVAGVPVIVLTSVLAIIAMLLYRKLRLDESIELTPPAVRLRASRAWSIVAWALVIASVGVPVGAMIASLDKPFVVRDVVVEVGPQLRWSISIALATGLIGVVIACLSAITPPRTTLLLALASFLIGGQFTAIAMLRIFSTSDLGVRILDWNIPVVLAHVSRFSWIALLAGASLHAGPWQKYRQMAAADGASGVQIFRDVIVGMGWPMIMLAGVLMGSLSLTEVPATALLVPPSLVPMLLTWVHQQNYGPMLEASLLLCGIVAVLGWGAVVCFWAFKKRLAAETQSRE